MEVKGIDVSEFQGNIDWERVKSSGIKYAIIKFGNIYDYDENYLDSKFETNYKKCKELGIKTGIYIYNYCNSVNTLKKSLEWVFEKLDNKKLEMPIYLDMEDKDIQGETVETLTNICNEFANYVKNKGYKAGVYANLNWLENELDPKKFNSDISVWVAQYYTECQYTGKYDIWQYTSSGKVDGVSGNCDMDYLYNENIINENENQGESEKTIEELSKEVIDGKWGDGEDRKKRLEEAGYDYNAVQDRVNEMVVLNNKDVTEIAKEVINGEWGNGEDRKNRLEQAGYNYDTVQAKVNQLLGADVTKKYIVKDGDTLSEIASKYKTTVESLTKNNNIENANLIYPGQEIVIK